MPNGDVLVAEALQEAGPPKTLLDRATQATMRRARSRSGATHPASVRQGEVQV